MRRLPQAWRAPATALAIMALIVAAAGGAYAATSGGGTISACVHHQGGGLYSARHCARHDRKLSWNVVGPRGAIGPAGLAGPQGAVGPQGVPGPSGPFPSVLPRGITVRGNWAGGSSASGMAFESISFGFAFASAPTFHYVPGPGSVPAGCSGGTSGNPTAQPGNLCLYSNGFPVNTSGPVVTGAPNAWGTLFTVSSSGPGSFSDGGTWAATSP